MRVIPEICGNITFEFRTNRGISGPCSSLNEQSKEPSGPCNEDKFKD